VCPERLATEAAGGADTTRGDATARKATAPTTEQYAITRHTETVPRRGPAFMASPYPSLALPSRPTSSPVAVQGPRVVWKGKGLSGLLYYHKDRGGEHMSW
jgi:hypothetical protein